MQSVVVTIEIKVRNPRRRKKFQGFETICNGFINLSDESSCLVCNFLLSLLFLLIGALTLVGISTFAILYNADYQYK